MNLGDIEMPVRHGHIFCGIGGGAIGFNRGHARVGRTVARFECVGGIDVDERACRDFRRLVGARATSLDLFDEGQYRAFHGNAPPSGWREASPMDLRECFDAPPHVVFLSAPCKGFSGLLSERISTTDKYQALNGLTLRGVRLLLEGYADDPIPLVLFENVPRIMTRGRWLLDDIGALLRRHGYAVAETVHDCGEIGGLGQSRKRFLLVARHEAKVPPFLYEPEKYRLKGVGEIIDLLPLPLSGLGGPMHRMPALQWKTWVRLALVRAGADWRSLNDLAVEGGYLRDVGIVPTAPVTSTMSPGPCCFAITDPHVDGHDKSVQLGIRSWEQPAGIVTGKMAVGSRPNSVADPRLAGKRYNTTFRVVRFDEPSPAVYGPGGAGGLAVGDPRPTHGPNAHTSKHAVMDWENPARTVTGTDRIGSGAMSVADPRGMGDDTRKNVLRVTPWGEHGGTVTSGHSPTNGGGAVADPRLEGDARNTRLGVVGWNEPSGTVAGESHPSNGAFAVADPMPEFTKGGRENYGRNAHYGVVEWGEPARAVAGAMQHDNGFGCVGDPRFETPVAFQDFKLPEPRERLVCVIRALDRTWHRPFTTLELAALQGLVDPEEMFELDGLSDSAWRERIGNCVPPPSAKAIASVMGETLIRALLGETFRLSAIPIWVRGVAVALAVDQRGNVPTEN